MSDNSKKSQKSPDQIILELKEGNERFKSNHQTKRNFQDEIKATGSGQAPDAIVLSCIDSRVSCELIFDQGIGDLFNIRLIGNVVSSDVLASLEYACQYSTAKLIVVMGHTNCGAVKGACDYVNSGHLKPSLTKIYPSIEKVAKSFGERSSKNDAFVNEAAKIHVWDVVDSIKKRSKVLKSLEDDHKIKIAGAMYSVSTGNVDFLNLEKQAEKIDA